MKGSELTEVTAIKGMNLSALHFIIFFVWLLKHVKLLLRLVI